MSPLRRRPASGASRGRRSGPADEQRWWDPDDQAFVEAVRLRRGEFGRGWNTMPMVNNAERLDPYGDGAAAEALRALRAARRLTALDEGRAWRHHRDGAVAVLRTEAFADDRPGVAADHREGWRAHGTACLDDVFRQRWAERDVEPGWIEARRRDLPAGLTDALASAVDWFEVEDQTGTAETEAVTIYEHLTIWDGRATAVLIIRHDQVLDVDDAAARAAASLHAQLARLTR